VNLEERAKDINRKCEAVQASHRTTAACAVEAGLLLIDTKDEVIAQLGHGSWMGYVEAHFGRQFHRTANVYMAVARRWRDGSPAARQELLSSTLEKALRVLPVSKIAATANSEAEDKEEERALKRIEPLSIVARYKSDKDKFLGLFTALWHVETALARAPPLEGWREHAEPHHVELVRRLKDTLSARIETMAARLEDAEGNEPS
jgi:hypothetical protein